ncbi:hypothetical protein Tco_0340684 [Tanacetum coccineum]
MSTIFALSYPSSNNQLETSSYLMHQVAMPERQTLSYVGNYSMGNDHIARSYTQSKKILYTGERINFGPGAFTVTTNALFQADGVEVYDSDCDDVPNAQPSFMANISSYGSDALVEVHNPDNVDNNMINQGVQYVTKSQQTTVQNSNSSAQQDALILSVIEQLKSQKAQQFKPKLYDDNVIKNTSASVIPDSEETLMLAEESRSKMLLKQQDPMMLEKKVNTTPVDYAALNQLSQDFEK